MGAKKFYIGGKEDNRSKVLALFLLISVMVFVFVAYTQGVSDSFYLDDFSNLDKLGEFNQVNDKAKVKEFVLGNKSGPTGRPVSMLSFLLDDNAWPSSAIQFKQTNIKLHLINGLVLFWLTITLLSSFSETRAIVFAAVVVTFWLANPLQSSTVLYPVQRMTQLSALFSMLAILSYLKFRLSLLEKGKLKTWFIAAVGVCFSLLAVFSKENAVVLPILILIIEFWWSKWIPWPNDRSRLMIFSIMILASAAILFFLFYESVSYGFFSEYPGRNFSAFERLLTQPEVMVYYLKELFFPSLYTSSLYYDYWPVNRSLLTLGNPFQFFSMIALLLFSFVLLRAGWLSGMGLTFFFGAHVLESTSLNLELVFEHRNYFPSIFLGFVISDGVQRLSSINASLRCFLVVVPFVIYFCILYERSRLWGQDIEFKEYLAGSQEQSLRANIAYSNVLLNSGFYERASVHSQKMRNIHERSVYVVINSILVKCAIGEVSVKDREALLRSAEQQVFDGRNLPGYKTLWRVAESESCSGVGLSLIDQLLQRHLVYYAQGDDARGKYGYRTLRKFANVFYASHPEYVKEGQYTLGDVLSFKDPEYLMNVAAQLASARQYAEAKRVAEAAEGLVVNGFMGASARDKIGLLVDIRHFLKVIDEDIEAAREIE